MDSKWLSKVAEHHKEYVNIVRSWGELDYCEDIVQETYLKLLRYTTEEKIINNGKVSKTYVWYALRSVYIEYIRSKGKLEKVELNNNIEYTTETEEAEAYGLILERIDREIDSWHYFDKLLFRFYISSGKSMREIAKDTNISLRTIFDTIKQCKLRIKENVGEDWDDFMNEDYEKI
jgi:RNA polymerase sigma factor (sigma-70 family)